MESAYIVRTCAVITVLKLKHARAIRPTACVVHGQLMHLLGPGHTDELLCKKEQKLYNQVENFWHIAKTEVYSVQKEYLTSKLIWKRVL